MRSRSEISQFYQMSPGKRALFNLLEKTSASASIVGFYGEKVEIGAVVRVDLNGYGKWSSSQSISGRVDLLDQYFSVIIPTLVANKGVYFRDEGDAIVGIFSSYFGNTPSFKDVVSFAMECVNRKYGADGLGSKCCISIGEIAFFQKSHEKGSHDWSAEGKPFVTAARLEAAVESRPAIHLLAEDFRANRGSDLISRINDNYWGVEFRNLQVPGLQLPSGWAELASLTFKG